MNAQPSTRQAFTLIELLVVITIIGVLAGLLLPVVGKVQENARKVSAKNTATQIIAAVNSYYTEYGTYPVPANTTGDYTYGTGGNSTVDLFAVLRAANTGDPTDTRNSRRISYFDYKPVKSDSSPKDGFANKSGTGNKSVSVSAGDLVDPWGNLYCVRIDSNYTGIVKHPYSDASATATDDPTTPPTLSDTTVLRTGVISYSIGADGTLGTTALPGDDVVSWQ